MKFEKIRFFLVVFIFALTCFHFSLASDLKKKNVINSEDDVKALNDSKKAESQKSAADQKKGKDKSAEKEMHKKSLKAEESIDKLLRSFIKKSKSFNVDYIRDNSAENSDPAFKAIHVSAEDANIDGLNVSKLDLEFNNVVFEREKLLIHQEILVKRSGKTGVNIIIKENDLKNFLKRKSEKIKIKDPEVSFNRDSISLSGRCKWWIIKAAFNTRGRFIIESSQDIHYIPDSISLSSVDMPSYVVSKVIKKINPVLSLRDFPLKVYLSKIEIKDKCLIISSSQNSAGCGNE